MPLSLHSQTSSWYYPFPHGNSQPQSSFCLIMLGKTPISEEVPPNAPLPHGKPGCHTCFFDANLMHDIVTGHSATCLLHLLNKTPSAWTSTSQHQVETATYGSEFRAACHYYTLHMFSVPLNSPAWVLGDNQAIINSMIIPHSSLSKCWNALSYHHCCEATAAGICCFEHIPSIQNPSDVLTESPLV